jgi:hypothetical protein
MKPFINFVYSAFVVLFLFCVSYADVQKNESTNPAKPIVDRLKLQNYDTALDKVDYHVPYNDIRWPWKDNVQRQEKRIAAIQKLLATNAGIYGEGYSNIESEIRDSQSSKRAYVRRMGWLWSYSELDDTLDVPDKVDDALLAETLPYIPEIEKISLGLTKVTDKGLESLFFLPVLKNVSIETPEPETHPLPITSQGIVLISQLPLLEVLFVRGIRLSDEALKKIAQNGKQIKRFVYWGDGISDIGIKYLNEMPCLEFFIFDSRVSPTVKNNTSPKLTTKVFIPLSQCQSLRGISLCYCDFQQIPDESILNTITNSNNKIRSIDLQGTKVHPLLVKSLCNIQSLIEISFFDGHSLQFNKENPISYAKVMYWYRSNEKIPDYYKELERPYFDEFYSRRWTSTDGKFTHEACFIDLKDNQVILKLKGETKEITVPVEKLSKEDQKYVQQIVRK